MAYPPAPLRNSRVAVAIPTAVVVAVALGIYAALRRSPPTSSEISSATSSSPIPRRDQASTTGQPGQPADVHPEKPAIAEPALGDHDIETAITLEELAHRDPSAAEELLRSLPQDDRRRAVAAVLTAAASQPQDAINLANRFIRADPENSTVHGYSLIRALTQVGQVGSALQFVQSQNAIPGESENPEKWLRALYAAWSEKQPGTALQHAAGLPAGGPQEEALRVVAKAWGKANPMAAADAVRRLAPGPARSGALEASLQAWADQDPAAAGQWLARGEAGSDLDGAAAVLATHPESLSQNPEMAAGWAERIVDPGLRSRTVAEVLKTWALKSPEEARRHAERATRSLLPEDRALVQAALNRPPD